MVIFYHAGYTGISSRMMEAKETETKQTIQPDVSLESEYTEEQCTGKRPIG